MWAGVAGTAPAATNPPPQLFTLSPLPADATPLPEMSGRLFAGPAHWAVQSGIAIGTFGTRVAAGDFNGDGRPELAVAMSRFRVRGRQVGKVWLFSFPSAAVVPRLDSEWMGNVLSLRSGEELAAGDVNGDGAADLLVGVYRVTEARKTIGLAKLFSGGPAGLAWSPVWDNLNQDSSAPAVKMLLADLNRDGFADALLASPRVDPIFKRGGKIWLYAGSSNGLSGEAVWSMSWPEKFGLALAVGDVNGDGWPDVLIGAPENGNGTVSVFSGSARGLAQEPSLVLTGQVEHAAFGSALAILGDLNGDGCQELAISAPGGETRRDWPGEVTLHWGAPTGLVRAAAWRSRGWRAGVMFGESLAGVGDVNGDGRPDLLVGAPGWFRGPLVPGRASLWLGRQGGFRANPDWELTADLDDTRLGAVVGGAGDLDGDGLHDFVITSDRQEASRAQTLAGRIDVFRGLRAGYGAGEHFPADGTVCVAGNFTVEARNLRIQAAVSSATNTTVEVKRTLAKVHLQRQRQYWAGGSAGALLCVTALWLWRSRRRVSQEATRHERERIARDLHDGLGSGVHRLQRLTELLNQVGAGSPEALRYRDELLQTAQELGGSMDRTIWAVKPENDTLENLVSYFADYAPSVLRPNGIECELDLPATLPARTLPGDTRQHLFLAVNEALNNVVKHARARQVWLRVTWAEPWLEIVVEDDGCGMGETAARAGGGNGLKNLHARLRSVQGSAELSPRVGGGMRVVLKMPL